ncbi:MAG: hypothetical protein AVDCRST_MAG89-1252 [uncultured Gemmatimonadetes bacterium]|uniref:Uncharacterized protein n=1 Tax=uncultured Gemmatimonadota bacterium TaxID=203437 RepID=A0A6J4KR40_9BACT|nr:MAG: hypothetical protein AVDCRST_MAG89-1252 [uncultured Gemmatimonadota bacterium]
MVVAANSFARAGCGRGGPEPGRCISGDRVAAAPMLKCIRG